MKSSCSTFIFSALLAACLLTTTVAGGQTSSKALFTGNAPYLCVGGGFVAMAGIQRNAGLIVMSIDVNGIEAPQTIARFDAINGMRCGAHHIELLALDYKSGHTIKFLYTVQWHSQNPSTVHEDQQEDISVPRVGPEPTAVDFLEWGGNRAGGNGRGDWYEWCRR